MEAYRTHPVANGSLHSECCSSRSSCATPAVGVGTKVSLSHQVTGTEVWFCSGFHVEYSGSTQCRGRGWKYIGAMSDGQHKRVAMPTEFLQGVLLPRVRSSMTRVALYLLQKCIFEEHRLGPLGYRLRETTVYRVVSQRRPARRGTLHENEVRIYGTLMKWWSSCTSKCPDRSLSYTVKQNLSMSVVHKQQNVQIAWTNSLVSNGQRRYRKRPNSTCVTKKYNHHQRVFFVRVVSSSTGRRRLFGRAIDLE